MGVCSLAEVLVAGGGAAEKQLYSEGTATTWTGDGGGVEEKVQKGLIWRIQGMLEKKEKNKKRKKTGIQGECRARYLESSPRQVSCQSVIAGGRGVAPKPAAGCCVSRFCSCQLLPFSGSWSGLEGAGAGVTATHYTQWEHGAACLCRYL